MAKHFEIAITEERFTSRRRQERRSKPRPGSTASTSSAPACPGRPWLARTWSKAKSPWPRSSVPPAP
jgi:hypothetical protein